MPGTEPAASAAETQASQSSKFDHVLIVGAGQMGAGIAQLVALSGRKVSLTDRDPQALQRAVGAARTSLLRLQRQDPSVEPEAIVERIAVVDSVVPADLLIEAVVEDQAAKEEILREADGVLGEEAVLATNTSSISITDLSRATGRPDRVIGMHFFNPVAVMKVVEVIPGADTSQETLHATLSFIRGLGRSPAVVGDHPAFVANRILIPMINEATYALEEGVADAETIDQIACMGLNQPMGPLALADLIGLDTCVAILEVLRTRRQDEKYAPSPLLTRYIQHGRLGRKTGWGFYRYEDASEADEP